MFQLLALVLSLFAAHAGPGHHVLRPADSIGGPLSAAPIAAGSAAPADSIGGPL